MPIRYAYHPPSPGPSHSKRIGCGDFRERLEAQLVELLERAADFDEANMARLTDLELCQVTDGLARVLR